MLFYKVFLLFILSRNLSSSLSFQKMETVIGICQQPSPCCTTHTLLHQESETQQEYESNCPILPDIAPTFPSSFQCASPFHHLIALLEGRDAETLLEWLKSHQKIRLLQAFPITYSMTSTLTGSFTFFRNTSASSFFPHNTSIIGRDRHRRPDAVNNLCRRIYPTHSALLG